MAEQGQVPGVRRYSHPAGGWDALKATARAVREQMHIAEAPLLLSRTNKPDGFDCPGCAWPDKEHTATFEFCENGAKAVTWEATDKRVTPEFFAAHTVAELSGRTDYVLENAGRLTHPMAYDLASDTYKPIDWDAAFSRIGEVLRALPDPNMAEFYTSGRASNEAAFLFQLFGRALGTNNFPDCSNMCHEATSVGLPQSIGIGKGTVSIDDFDHCELIIAMGHNPGTNHPRMMGTLHECSRRGVPIIVFNPLKERALERFADPQNPIETGTFGSTRIASSYYQVKIGGDAAALKGIIKAVLEWDDTTGDALDHNFIACHTIGFEALAADLRATAWPDIERASGLSRADLERVAECLRQIESHHRDLRHGHHAAYARHPECTTDRQSAAAARQFRQARRRHLSAARPLERPGRPHRGHYGKADTGTHRRHRAGLWFPPAQSSRPRCGRRDGGNGRGALEGIDLPWGQFLDRAARSLRLRSRHGSLDLAVHLNTKLNRSHLLIGKEAIILPVLGRTERDIQASGPQAITVEDSMSMVHASRGKLKPASEHLRSEPAIIAGMAAATLLTSKIDWLHLIEDYDRIRDRIEIVFPDFRDYNNRIRKPGGFRLPIGPTERVWKTPSGRAQFIVIDGVEEDPVVDTPNVLKLATMRSHDQYNTTIYGLNDRYRGVFGRRKVLFMNEGDLAARGLYHGDLVWVEPAVTDGAARRLRLTAICYDIAAGSVAAYYPEANGLVPLVYRDKDSGTPSYKSVPVHVRRAA